MRQVCACIVCMALTTAKVLCSRSRDSFFVSDSERGNIRFSYKPLLTSKEDRIEPPTTMHQRKIMTTVLP